MISTGGQLTILESVDSTNNYAMARVRTGLAKHGDGFFAMAQTKGKGQRGKTWITERGTNIIISLVMQPHSPVLQQQFQLSTAVALAAHDFFAQYAGDETFIKWPNDIFWRDRKAGGILIENLVGNELPYKSQQQGDDTAIPKRQTGFTPVNKDNSPPNSWQWAIIGIGININQTVFPAHIRNAVSLKQISGRDHDVVEMAKELCGHIQNRYRQLLSGVDLLQAYNNRLYKKGQVVKFKKGSRIFEGLVKEVNRMGELVIIAAVEEQFTFGEVEWILPDNQYM